MKIIDLRCRDCGYSFEDLVTEEVFKTIVYHPGRNTKKCPKCGKTRLYKDYSRGAPAVHFKGKGFYATDYKDKK